MPKSKKVLTIITTTVYQDEDGKISIQTISKQAEPNSGDVKAFDDPIGGDDGGGNNPPQRPRDP